MDESLARGHASSVTTGYIICTTPRSGSTLLCSMFAATGRAGNPDSFYHERHFMREWAHAWRLPDADTVSSPGYDAAYLAAAIAAGRGGTPLFGMRLQQAYLAPLATTLDRLYPGLASDTERFARAFGAVRYVHLIRRDKLAQAVSLVRAQQSGLWHRNADGGEMERTAPPQEPAYDAAAIRAQVALLTEADHAWSQWFARERIAPLRITYEAFVQDPAATVIALCAVLGIAPPDAVTLTPPTARLADAISAEWMQRYRDEFGPVFAG